MIRHIYTRTQFILIIHKCKFIIKFRWRASRERMIIEMPDGCWDWAWLSKMVTERPIVNSFPWVTESPGSRLPSTVCLWRIKTSPPRSDRHFWSERPLVTPQSYDLYALVFIYMYAFINNSKTYFYDRYALRYLWSLCTCTVLHLHMDGGSHLSTKTTRHDGRRMCIPY